MMLAVLRPVGIGMLELALSGIVVFVYSLFGTVPAFVAGIPAGILLFSMLTVTLVTASQRLTRKWAGESGNPNWKERKLVVSATPIPAVSERNIVRLQWAVFYTVAVVGAAVLAHFVPQVIEQSLSDPPLPGLVTETAVVGPVAEQAVTLLTTPEFLAIMIPLTETMVRDSVRWLSVSWLVMSLVHWVFNRFISSSLPVQLVDGQQGNDTAKGSPVLAKPNTKTPSTRNATNQSAVRR